jgi:ketosteroid isomerase-like protein
MTTLPSRPERASSISGTIAPFYQLLAHGDLDTWAALWAENGAYLNPFAAEPFPRQRVAGRAEVIDTLQTMRDCFEYLQFRDRKTTPALAPAVEATVVYVSGDWEFETANTPHARRSHFHHRLEVVDGVITGWVDYTNPLTRNASVLSTAAKASSGGDGQPGSAAAPVPPPTNHLEVAPGSPNDRAASACAPLPSCPHRDD